MFMPFDRTRQPAPRQTTSRHTDAATTPFVERVPAPGTPPSTGQRPDYREQADGAP